MYKVEEREIYTSSWERVFRNEALILCNEVGSKHMLNYDEYIESNTDWERYEALEPLISYARKFLEDNGKVDVDDLTSELQDCPDYYFVSISVDDEEAIQKAIDSGDIDHAIKVFLENADIDCNEGESEIYGEIYQFYLTNFSRGRVEWLCEHFSGLKFAYSEELDLWVLLVDHYGTGWSIVPIETDLPCFESKEVCEAYKTPQTRMRSCLAEI